MNSLLRRGRIALLVLPLALAGCELFEQGGRVDLRLTDAPIDGVSKVVVVIEGVEFRDVDGSSERFSFPTPRQIDLLELSNGRTTLLLEDELLPEGDYDSIRLRLRNDPDDRESYVQLQNGQIFGLYVPEGEEGKLRISSDFTIEEGDRREMTIDFDLRRSLREPDDEEETDAYRLLPSLRVVEDRRTGTITGRIADSRLGSDCAPAVYVYPGRVTPVDIGGSGTQPLTSSRVLRDLDGDARYTAAFLPEGEYTVAFTCEADEDDPADADDISFVSDQRVTVDARETVTQNF